MKPFVRRLTLLLACASAPLPRPIVYLYVGAFAGLLCSGALLAADELGEDSRRLGTPQPEQQASIGEARDPPKGSYSLLHLGLVGAAFAGVCGLLAARGRFPKPLFGAAAGSVFADMGILPFSSKGMRLERMSYEDFHLSKVMNGERVVDCMLSQSVDDEDVVEAYCGPLLASEHGYLWIRFRSSKTLLVQLTGQPRSLQVSASLTTVLEGDRKDMVYPAVDVTYGRLKNEVRRIASTFEYQLGFSDCRHFARDVADTM